MAFPVLFRNAYVSINGVDLSDHVKEVELPPEVEQLDDTVMGDDTKSNYPGLLNWRCRVRFLQDFTAAKVDATLFPLLGQTTGFTVEVRPDTAARSATNPGYTATGILASYTPLSGGVGQMLGAECVIVPGGASPKLLRQTS